MANKFTFSGGGTFGSGSFGGKKNETQASNMGTGASRSPSVDFDKLNAEEQDVYKPLYKDWLKNNPDDYEGAMLHAEEGLFTWQNNQKYFDPQGRLVSGALNIGAQGRQPSIDFDDITDKNDQDAYRLGYRGWLRQHPDDYIGACIAGEDELRRDRLTPDQQLGESMLGDLGKPRDQMPLYLKDPEYIADLLRMNGATEEQMAGLRPAEEPAAPGMTDQQRAAYQAAEQERMEREQREADDRATGAGAQVQQLVAQKELERYQAEGKLDANAERILNDLQSINSEGRTMSADGLAGVWDTIDTVRNPEKPGFTFSAAEQESIPDQAAMERAAQRIRQDMDLEGLPEDQRAEAEADLADLNRYLSGEDTSAGARNRAAEITRDWNRETLGETVSGLTDLLGVTYREAGKKVGRIAEEAGKWAINVPSRWEDIKTLMANAGVYLAKTTPDVMSFLGKIISGEHLYNLAGQPDWLRPWFRADELAPIKYFNEGVAGGQVMLQPMNQKFVERAQTELMPVAQELGFSEDEAKQGLGFLANTGIGVFQNIGDNAVDMFIGWGTNGLAMLSELRNISAVGAANISALEGGKSFISLAWNGLKNALGNPQAMTRFMKTYSSTTEELAAEKGSADKLTSEDYKYAVAHSMFNTAIEYGGGDDTGGVEALFGGKRNNLSLAARLFGPVPEEMAEEVGQGLEEKAQKNVFDFFSGRDLTYAKPIGIREQNALIDLAEIGDTLIATAAQTLGMDAIYVGTNGLTNIMNKAIANKPMTKREAALGRMVAIAADGLQQQAEQEEQHDTFEDAVNGNDLGRNRTPGTDPRAQAAVEVETAGNQGAQAPKGNPKDMRAVREATERKAEADQAEQEFRAEQDKMLELERKNASPEELNAQQAILDQAKAKRDQARDRYHQAAVLANQESTLVPEEGYTAEEVQNIVNNGGTAEGQRKQEPNRPVKEATERQADEGAPQTEEAESGQQPFRKPERPVKGATERTADETEQTLVEAEQKAQNAQLMLRNAQAAKARAILAAMEEGLEADERARREQAAQDAIKRVEVLQAEYDRARAAADAAARGQNEQAENRRGQEAQAGDRTRQTLVETGEEEQENAQRKQEPPRAVKGEEGRPADEAQDTEQETAQRKQAPNRPVKDATERTAEDTAGTMTPEEVQELVLNGEGPGPDQVRPGNAGEEQEKPGRKPVPQPENEQTPDNPEPKTPDNPEPPTQVNPETPQTAQDDRQEGTPQEEDVTQELVNNGEGPGPDQVRPGYAGEEQEKPEKKPAPVPENELTPSPEPEQEKTEVTQGQGQEQTQTPQTAQDNRRTGTPPEAEEEEGIGKQEGQTKLTEEKTETGNTAQETDEDQERNAGTVSGQYGWNHLKKGEQAKTGVNISSWSGTEVTDAQRADLSAVDMVAKGHNLIVVMDSTLEKGRANGYYTERDSQGRLVIHIAQDAENPIRTVFSHELAHLVRANNPRAWNSIVRVWDEYMRRGGVDIANEMEKLRTRYREAGLKVPSETRLTEELIADSLYDVIGDERTVRALAMSDRGVVRQIRDWVSKVMADIRRMLNRYADNHPGARTLRDTEGAMQKLRDMIDQALNDIDKVQASKKAVQALGENGEMTKRYQEKVKNAASRQEMNAAADDLAWDMLEEMGESGSKAQRIRLMNAAKAFVTGGGTMSEVLRDYGFTPWGQNEEMNRAFAMLGKYAQGVMKEGADAYVEMMGLGENSEENTTGEEAENGGKLFSIKMDADGNMYVDVDVDQKQFDGLDWLEIRQKAREVIRTKFKKHVLDPNHVRAYLGKDGADEYIYPKKKYHDRSIMPAKLRASTELENLLVVSEFRNHEPPDMVEHPEYPGGWDYYTTRFKVGRIALTGLVNIGIDDKGRRHFYDVTVLKKIHINENAGDQHRQSENTPHAAIDQASIDNIPQSETEVNNEGGISLSLKKFDKTVPTDEKLPASMEDIYRRDYEINQELRDVQKKIKDHNNSEEVRDLVRRLHHADPADMDTLLQEYKELEERSGIAKATEREKELKAEKEALKAQEETIRRNQLVEEIRKSGKTEEEFFRDRAVREFGYTTYFYDAGYILPNGKMLNFSGEKGKHFGTRGQDHRAISTIYDGTLGATESLNDFVNKGNVRIIDEAPGIDVSISEKLTEEQEATIRKHILQSGKNRYTVDLTGPDGKTVRTLEYEAGVKPSRVLEDIAKAQNEGVSQERSLVADFHTRWSAKEGTGETSAPELTQEEIQGLQERNAALEEEVRGLQAKAEQADSAARQLAKEVLERNDALEQLKQSKATRQEVANARAMAKAAEERFQDQLMQALEYRDQRDRAVAEQNRLRAQLGAEKRNWRAKIRKQEEARVAGQVERLKKNNREWKKEYREKAEVREKRRKNLDRIVKETNKLQQMIAHPGKKKGYVPEGVLKAAGEWLNALNEGRGLELSMAGRALQRQMNKALNKETDGDQRVFSPQLLELMDEALSIMEDAAAEAGETVLIRDLTPEQIGIIADTAQGVNRAIELADRLIGRESYQEVQKESESMIRTAEKHKVKLKGPGRLGWKFLIQHMNPQTFFQVLGHHENNALTRSEREMTEGARKRDRIMMKATKIFEPLTTGANEKKFDRMTGKNAEWYDTGIPVLNLDGSTTGRTMEMTQGMRVSLWLNWQSEDNRQRMCQTTEEEAAEGKPRVYVLSMPDKELFAKGKVEEAYKRGYRVTVTEAQVNAILDEMTDYEMDWAHAWQKAEETVFRPAINETSMEMNGWEIAGVDNYFPIITNPNFVGKDFESVVSDSRLTSMGILKERVEGAKNPTLLMDIADVVGRQIDSVANYAGLAIPVQNFTRVWNGVMPGYTQSVKEAMINSYGPEAVRYIEDFMRDIQGGSRMPNGFMSKLRSRYAGAVLTFSPATTIKQSASLLAAAGSVSWESLAKSVRYFATPKRIDPQGIMDRYTAAHWVRESNSLAGLEANANRNNKAKKGLFRMGNTIQAMDLLTTKVLWKAAEFEIQKTTDLRPGAKEDIEAGTDAYYKAVAAKYEEILETSQPQYGAMQKNAIQRSQSELVRSLTMFKTQPFQNMNLLINSITNYSDKAADAKANPDSAEAKAALGEARVKLARTVSGQVASAVMVAVMTALGKALMHKMGGYRDDKGDITPESVGAQLMRDSASSVMGMVAGGTELYNLVDGLIQGRSPYDIEAAGVSTVNELYQNTYNLWQASTVLGDADMTAEEKWNKMQPKLWKFAGSLSQIFGWPTENVRGLIDGIAANTKDMIAGKPFSYQESGLSFIGAAQGRETSNSAVAGYIAQAMMDGNEAEATRLYNEQLRQGKTADSLNTAIATWQKANIPEIRQAAEAIDGGDLTEYNRLINVIVGKGVSMTNAVKYVEAVRKKSQEGSSNTGTALTYQEILDGMTKETATSEANAYTNGMMNSLLEDGNVDAAKAVRDDMLANGKKAAGINSSLTSYWKPKLQEAYENGDMAEVRRITSMLVEMGMKRTTVSGWTQEKSGSSSSSSKKKSGFGSGSFGSGSFGNSKKSSKKSGFGSGSFGSGKFGS